MRSAESIRVTPHASSVDFQIGFRSDQIEVARDSTIVHNSTSNWAFLSRTILKKFTHACTMRSLWTQHSHYASDASKTFSHVCCLTGLKLTSAGYPPGFPLSTKIAVELSLGSYGHFAAAKPSPGTNSDLDRWVRLDCKIREKRCWTFSTEFSLIFYMTTSQSLYCGHFVGLLRRLCKSFVISSSRIFILRCRCDKGDDDGAIKIGLVVGGSGRREKFFIFHFNRL